MINIPLYAIGEWSSIFSCTCRVFQMSHTVLATKINDDSDSCYWQTLYCISPSPRPQIWYMYWLHSMLRVADEQASRYPLQMQGNRAMEWGSAQSFTRALIRPFGTSNIHFIVPLSAWSVIRTYSQLGLNNRYKLTVWLNFMCALLKLTPQLAERTDAG